VLTIETLHPQTMAYGTITYDWSALDDLRHNVERVIWKHNAHALSDRCCITTDCEELSLRM
jgi:hypothetical protein